MSGEARCLIEHCLKVLVQALILLRTDYYNSVPAGLPETTPQTAAIDVCQRSSTMQPHHALTSVTALASNPWQNSLQDLSRSSCTIYRPTPTLHHTICHPWSRPAPPSCPGRVCDLLPSKIQRRLHLTSILPDVWKSSRLNQWAAGLEQPSRINSPLYNCWIIQVTTENSSFSLNHD